jgi:hypothetical protein
MAYAKSPASTTYNASRKSSRAQLRTDNLKLETGFISSAGFLSAGFISRLVLYLWPVFICRFLSAARVFVAASFYLRLFLYLAAQAFANEEPQLTAAAPICVNLW